MSPSPLRSSSSDRNAPVPAGVPAGARVGGYWATASEPSRLELRPRRTFAAGFIGGGLLMMVWGALVWVGWLPAYRSWSMLNALVMIAVGLLCVFVGVIHLDSFLVFSGELRRLERHSRLLGLKVYEAGYFADVRLDISESESAQREQVHLMLSKSNPKAIPRVLDIGWQRTLQQQTVHLVTAAGQIARLLDLPVRIEGESTTGNSSVLQAMQSLRNEQ